jgi:hypothetical protein
MRYKNAIAQIYKARGLCARCFVDWQFAGDEWRLRAKQVRHSSAILNRRKFICATRIANTQVTLWCSAVVINFTLWISFMHGAKRRIMNLAGLKYEMSRYLTDRTAG